MVCLEGGARPVTCGCNTHLHDDCLCQLVLKMHTEQCSVCLRPYRNIQVKHTVQRTWHPFYSITAFIFAIACAELFLVAWLWDMKDSTTFFSPGITIVCILFLSTGIALGVITVSRLLEAYFYSVPCCMTRTGVTQVDVTS